MKDETGKEMSEKELMTYALNYIAEACGILFEIETPEGMALAFMADSVLRYGDAIKQGRDPRLSEE